METAPTEKELKKQAASDAAAKKRKDDFAQAIVEARMPQPEPPPPPPASPRILSKTQLEIEAGRKRSEHFAEQERLRKALPRPDVNEGGSIPVFRPGDYVPNMNQGKQKASVVKG